MNINKIIYWIATSIMCFIFLFSAFNYFTQYEMIAGFFDQFGFPRWVIYPLAIAKVLAVIAILSKQSKLLKEWAYAGFFFDAVLAYFAHHFANDGAGMFAIIALVATLVSRLFENKDWI